MSFSELHRVLMAEDQIDQSPIPSPGPAPFRPSIAIIVGVLTTVFSLTFLLLLYAKHCKRRGDHYPHAGGRGLQSAAEQRNSGVARSVVESLPAFRFGSLQGEKEGLECAVCLNPFEPAELLRLLPKCKHGFHVECVDVWLEAHSTCPLCRVRVHPEDLLLLLPGPKPEPDPVSLPRRISGRHSSAGEKSSWRSRSSSSSNSNNPSILQVVVQSDHGGNVTAARGRKDGLLLTADREEFERRYGHRIVVSGCGDAKRRDGERWSDLRPSDLLFLRSDSLRPSGRNVNTLRSVSEITGMRRFGGMRTAVRLANGTDTEGEDL